MVTINVLDHVERCYSNTDGKVIYNMILPHFYDSEKVAVSFKGIDSVTSSFVNSAFIPLLDTYDFNTIKEKLTFVNSSRQINEMIKRRFKFEVDLKKVIYSS